MMKSCSTMKAVFFACMMKRLMTYNAEDCVRGLPEQYSQYPSALGAKQASTITRMTSMTPFYAA